MKIFVAVIVTLAVASAEANLYNDVEHDYSEVEAFVRNAYNNLIDDISHASKLSGYLRGLTDQKRSQFNMLAESAKNKVDKDQTLSDKCKEEVKKQIEGHKVSNVANFFTCSNLTDAMVETGSIIVLSLELTANVTENFNAIFTRLSACNSESIIKRPVCWFEAVLDVKDDIQTDMGDIAFFKQRVFKLAHDIGANVEFCAHPPKQNLTAAIQKAMASAKDCQVKLNYAH